MDSELSVDLFGRKIDDMELENCGCGCLSLDSEHSVDLYGGKIDDMELENCGCECLSLDSEHSVDLFGGKIDDMEWEYCGTISVDAEPPDQELFAGKIDGIEGGECDILVSSQIELSGSDWFFKKKIKLRNFVRDHNTSSNQTHKKLIKSNQYY